MKTKNTESEFTRTMAKQERLVAGLVSDTVTAWRARSKYWQRRAMEAEARFTTFVSTSIKPPPMPAPYAGKLRDHVDEILALDHDGKGVHEILEALQEKHPGILKRLYPDGHPNYRGRAMFLDELVRQHIHYVLNRHGRQPLPSQLRNDYAQARREHAWLLRAEGLSIGMIASRLGVTKARAGMMLSQAKDAARKATRHTRWKWK